MADKTIKTTIELAGEKEYNEALRQAQRNLRTLRSELKAETAELGANATAQQKNEVRIKSLKKQIAEQEKTVATLKKALAQAKQDYGDNEDVVQKWEQKLNAARSTLAGMQNDLESLSASMEGVTGATEMGVVATKSFADTVESIGTVCSSVADGIEGIFRGMIGAVESAAVELWEFIGETAAKANNYNDIAGYWGTDAATIQKYANAVEDTSNSFEDLQSAVSRLVLGGKGKKIAEYLGISDVKYENEWDYAMAAMKSIYDLQEQGKLADGFWEDVFGEKKATKVMDLVNDWGAIMESLDKYDADKGGFGMDSDALAVMDQVWVKMSSIETMWTALKDEIAAGLGTVTMPLMVDVQGGLSALNDYLKADSDEARQAALDALVGSIESFFTHLGEALAAGIDKLREVADALQESDNPGVRALGDALDFIADGLEWMVEHADDVKKALETMFGLWLVMKLGAIAAMVTGIVAKIEVIKAFSAVGSGLSGAASAAAGAAGASGNAAAAASGSAAVKTLDAGTVTAAGKAIGGAALAAIGYLFKEGIDYRNLLPGRMGSAENIEYVAEQDDELKEALIDYVTTQQEQQEFLDKGDVFSEESAEAMTKAAEAAERFWGMDGAQMAYDMFNDYRQENGMGNMDYAMPDELADKWGLNSGDVEAMVDAVESLPAELDTVVNGSEATYNPEVAQNIVDSVSGVSGTLSSLPGSFASAVARALSGVKVYLDGEAVGRLTTNTVSMGIAGRVISEIK